MHASPMDAAELSGLPPVVRLLAERYQVTTPLGIILLTERYHVTTVDIQDSAASRDCQIARPNATSPPSQQAHP